VLIAKLSVHIDFLEKDKLGNSGMYNIKVKVGKVRINPEKIPGQDHYEI
jgi:hypothetical protein